MRTRFILSTSATQTSAASKQMLTTKLQALGWQVWHWQEDLWLISGETNGEVTAEILNDGLAKSIPALKGNFMVIEAKGKSPYNGYQNQEAWDWMKKFWGEPDG